MTLMTLNSIIAGVIGLVAIASVKAMNGTTRHSVRFAILAILAGAAGQAIGFAAGAWDHYLDTILYIGILALMFSNVRSPAPIPPRWSARLAFGTLIAGGLIVVGYLTVKHAAAAPTPPIETPYVIVPLNQDRAGGTVTLWLADVHRLIHDRAWLIDELGRMRAGCGGV